MSGKSTIVLVLTDLHRPDAMDWSPWSEYSEPGLLLLRRPGTDMFVKVLSEFVNFGAALTHIFLNPCPTLAEYAAMTFCGSMSPSAVRSRESLMLRELSGATKSNTSLSNQDRHSRMIDSVNCSCGCCESLQGFLLG